MKLVEETTIDESVQRLNDFMESQKALLTPEQKEAILAEKFLTDHLGMQVTDYVKFSTNYSFDVPTELEAYKAAYRYKHVGDAIVTESKLRGNWRVRIYES